MDPGSAVHHIVLRSIRGTSEIVCYEEVDPTVCISATFRKHSRHRQSSPATGIGSRAISVAHQQSPPGLQANSVPQREQARRRGDSVRLFMTAL
jgi:hypothetical protein